MGCKQLQRLREMRTTQGTNHQATHLKPLVCEQRKCLRNVHLKHYYMMDCTFLPVLCFWSCC